MTKQLIGAVPLVCPLVEWLARDGDRRLWRDSWRGLVAAALVWVPWHVRQLGHHGHSFVSAYLGQNVVERSQTALLHLTRPTYYLRELWRSETWLTIPMALAVAFVVYTAVRHRRRRELLLALSVLGPFIVFTLASSRYDHYVLIIYPALALSVAHTLTALPLRPLVAVLVAVAFIATATATHLWRDLSSFDGDDEIKELIRLPNGDHHPLYAYNTHVYSARYYLESATVTTLLESRTDYDTAQRLHAAGMPASVVLATDLANTLTSLPRPYWLLLPRARAALVTSTTLQLAAESPHYLLLRAPSLPPSLPP